MSARARGGIRPLFPLALMVSVAVLFTLVWQSAGEQSDFASLERDGVRYIQALVPLEIELTNAEASAVKGSAVSQEPLAQAVAAVAVQDKELGERLRTEDRWTELRTKIDSLPTTGSATDLVTSYGGVNDLLLALMDKVRNNSKLIRDPEAGTYYLEDGAAQELPEGVVAAAEYTNLLLSVADRPESDQAAATTDIISAHSDLASNAKDLSDDVRLAVEEDGGGALGAALLFKLDRFNRSIDGSTKLMAPLNTGKGRIDTLKVASARDETQAAAADLSVALLAQIDGALADRIETLGQRRMLALVTLAVPILLGLVPVGMRWLARRREEREQPKPITPAPVEPQHAARPVTVPPSPPAAEDDEYARWERFGASQ